MKSTRRIWTKWLLGISALFLLLFFGVRPLLSQMPRWLVVDEDPQPSDLIVVLSGQDYLSRLRYGASLFKEGYAPRIVLSGFNPLEKETGIYLGQVYLRSAGVPDSAIHIENGSHSTYENAIYLQQLLEEQGYGSFILVTSPMHTRRSRMLFKRVVDPSIRWSVASDTGQLDLTNWWLDVVTAREVFYEYMALPYSIFFESGKQRSFVSRNNS